MVELVGGMKAKELTKMLLIKYNLFVKDLSGKVQTGEYLRFAVRNTEDNDKLLSALKRNCDYSWINSKRNRRQVYEKFGFSYCIIL